MREWVHLKVKWVVSVPYLGNTSDEVDDVRGCGTDDGQRLPLAEVAAEAQLADDLTALLLLLGEMLEVQLRVLEVTSQSACKKRGGMSELPGIEGRCFQQEMEDAVFR